MKKLLLFTLLSLALASCSDAFDVLNPDPGYFGGTPGQVDEDHCDGC